MRNIHFLLYDNRSGSTLLSALLNRYGNVAVSAESGYVYKILERPRTTINERELSSIIEGLFQEVQFRELNFDKNELSDYLHLHSPKTKYDLILRISEYYFSITDPLATVCIIKGPRLFYNLSDIVRSFPDSFCISIVRDGRAVFNSKKKSVSLSGFKMETNLLKAAYDWKLRNDYIEKYKERIIQVRYEDLIADEKIVCASVLSQLGLRDEAQNITKTQDAYYERIGRRQSHLHTNVSSIPRSDIANAWRDELSETDIFLYGCIAGAQLSKLGFNEYRMKRVGLGIAVRATIKLVFYALHFLGVKFRNIGVLLVRGELTNKFSAKLHEFRNTP